MYCKAMGLDVNYFGDAKSLGGAITPSGRVRDQLPSAFAKASARQAGAAVKIRFGGSLGGADLRLGVWSRTLMGT